MTKMINKTNERRFSKVKKQILISLLLVMAMFIPLSMVYAAGEFTVTMISPVTSGDIGGTTILNATVSEANVTNCTFFAKSVSTANSSWVNVGLVFNSTAAQTINFATTFSSNIFEDSNDYQFFATCVNLSAVLRNSTIQTGITIDNFVPDIPVLTTPLNYHLVRNTSVIPISVAVSGHNTTGCTLYTERGGQVTTYAMTHIGDTCTYSTLSFSGTTVNGNYNWHVLASDGTNTTDSSLNQIQVQFPGTGGGLTPQQVQEIQKQQKEAQGTLSIAIGSSNIEVNKGLLWFIGIVVVIVLFIVLIFKKK